MDNLDKGRGSLLQALGLMRDEEGFRNTYGAIPGVISSRRETSVKTLCDVIVQMDEKIRNMEDERKEYSKLVEEAADAWKLFQEDREKKAQRIKQLEEENKTLKAKLERFEGSRPSTSSEWSASASHQNRISSPTWEDSERKEDERESHSFGQEDISRRNRTERMQFSSRRDDFDHSTTTIQGNYDDYGNDHLIMDPFASQAAGVGYAPIRENPYGKLDTTYFSPSQFFQRQSTTNVRRSRGGKRGGATGGTRGRKKKADSCSGSQEKRKPKKRARGAKRAAAEMETINLEEQEGDDSANMSLAAALEHECQNQHSADTYSEGNKDESPEDKSYFDFTNTFLDETE